MQLKTPPASDEQPASTLVLRPYQATAVAAALGAPGASRLIVAPVGSGKTAIGAEIARQRLSEGRVLVLTHTGELVDQNARTIARQCPGVPVGVCAGGLNRRDVAEPVVVGNIATVHRATEALLRHGPVATVIVDECHRIDPDGVVYAQTLRDLRASCSDLVLIGLTGSPWRDGHGFIAVRGRRDQDPIFETVAYEIAHADMVRAGFIVPVRPRRTRERIDLAGIGTNAFGDFATGELDERVNRDEVNRAAIAEVVAYGRAAQRRRWLVFAVTIDHAERLVVELAQHGVMAAAVSAKTPAKERAEIIARFRTGALTAVVNVAALTTGFDVPEVDLIALLRPTKSRVLYYQMLGRGTRTSPGKSDCVVLDFAGSTLQIGRLEDIEWQIDELPSGPRFPITWCCSECDTYNARRVMACEACGAEKPTPKAAKPVDREKVLSATDVAIGFGEPRRVAVRHWSARLFLAGGIDNLQVWFTPASGGDLVSHAFWFSDRYPGARDRLTAEWIRFGGRLPVPRTATEALSRFEAGELDMPAEIVAKPVPRNGRTYWNLRDAFFLEAA